MQLFIHMQVQYSWNCIPLVGSLCSDFYKQVLYQTKYNGFENHFVLNWFQVDVSSSLIHLQVSLDIRENNGMCLGFQSGIVQIWHKNGLEKIKFKSLVLLDKIRYLMSRTRCAGHHRTHCTNHLYYFLYFQDYLNF